MKALLGIEKFADEHYIKIGNVDLMDPFLMNIVSDTNHWMFVTSNGGITLGRKNAEYALFPYETDDKLIRSINHTGPKTIFKLNKNSKIIFWEPFSKNLPRKYNIERNIYKNFFGNKLIFEEVNTELKLTYRYHWNTSSKYGFIKKSELINNSNDIINISVLDGLQGILPYGIPNDLQQSVSNLGDAYKRNELIENTNLGIYSLSSMIVDRAEPSEALKASIVWSLGIKAKNILLSSKQVDSFLQNKPIHTEKDVKGEKGSYFVISDFEIKANSDKTWEIISDVNKSQSGVIAISKEIKEETNLKSKIEKDIHHGLKRLKSYVAKADSLFKSSDVVKNNRHKSNVLFNIMRGGIFHDNYSIPKEDFAEYILNANQEVYKQNKGFLESLESKTERKILLNEISKKNDSNFHRLAVEYLPLKFSRRHGDPSRPWNYFNINTIDENTGKEILDYEGNWRDLFQNWEALAHSYPAYINGMIFKFLNSSTFDGYNPYRVTKSGYDWEIIDPDNPWSYIGYWGDHQIIYLLKFLEFASDYYPNLLSQYFNEDIFVYAAVPYKIKSYEELVKNPHDTIIFDVEWDTKLRDNRNKTGADGTLITLADNSIFKVNLIEKLLAVILAKISNFIPDAGIWMNTQRPEWNDANNALVGNGVSMVTLYYLRRFINFFKSELENTELERVYISNELRKYYHDIRDSYNDYENILSQGFNDKNRKEFLDLIGKHASDYRNQIYDKGFWGKKSSISINGIKDFLKLILKFIDQCINNNKRDDKLYHSYNIITIQNDDIQVSHLDEMLEGQVAALSSGKLSAKESISLLKALKNSNLYRKDQDSYILYPNKELSGFLEKNNIPKDLIKSSALLQVLISDNNLNIINKDINGNYHFNSELRNAKDLEKILNSDSMKNYEPILSEDRNKVLEIYEKVFNHKSFTGRSGTFFAYEGLGSIYWHMVSKLLLATYETYKNAVGENHNKDIIEELKKHFFNIKDGIGAHKSPEEYGAFPTDAYSHTPIHRGVQQPGMTGQVKEDILSHYGEMGIQVINGLLNFKPGLLNINLFSNKEYSFSFINVNNKEEKINLKSDSFCFSYCQVPVVYRISDSNNIKVEFYNTNEIDFNSLTINKDISKKLFNRSGEIKQITVFINNSILNKNYK